MSYWSNDQLGTDDENQVFGHDLIGDRFLPGPTAQALGEHDEALVEPMPVRRKRISSRKLRARITNGSDLEGFDLRRARLDCVDLSDRDLSGLNLHGAHLRRARLTGCDLSQVDLTSADLREADLRDARLAGANAFDAYMRDADLSHADLTGVRNLEHAFVEGARSDSSTKWPAGFDPVRAGIVRR